jgi:hypothetical protein
MLQFAKDIGAMRNGRPDWYAVAERLAPFAAGEFPQLLQDDFPVSRPAHRPRKEDWYWLFRDVDLVRRQRNCTVKKACELLAKGEKPYRARYTVSAGERHWIRIQSGAWQGTKAKTLEQRYYEWLRHQKKQPLKNIELR